MYRRNFLKALAITPVAYLLGIKLEEKSSSKDVYIVNPDGSGDFTTLEAAFNTLADDHGVVNKRIEIRGVGDVDVGTLTAKPSGLEKYHY
jgi:hypothetical protein